MTFYQATRHTFASHYVLDGGRMDRLACILGHSTTWVTERYAHLRPEVFTPADFTAATFGLEVDDGGALVTLRYKGATAAEN